MHIKGRFIHFRRNQGKSFKQLLLIGAGLLKADGKRVLGRVEIGKCSVCHKPLLWNLTDPTHRKVLDDTLERASMHHHECGEKGRSP